MMTCCSFSQATFWGGHHYWIVEGPACSLSAAKKRQRIELILIHISSRSAWTPACECSRAPAMDAPLREAAMSRASCDQRGHKPASNSKLKHIET